MKTVEISDGMYNLIAKKARESDTTISKMHEHMIMSFSPSTDKELKKMKECRKALKEDFFKNNPKANRLQVYNFGFHAGWFLFQVRKEITFESLHVRFDKYFRSLGPYLLDLKRRGIYSGPINSEEGEE